MMYLLLLIIIVAAIVVVIKTKRTQKNIDPKEVVYGTFNTDIRDIFKYNPTFVDEEVNSVGSTFRKYELNLPIPELGCFTKAEIVLHKNYEKTVAFIANPYAITTQVEKYINDCADVLGTDSSGAGRLTAQEKNSLARKSNMYVSRMWKNKDLGIEMWISIDDNSADITLFSVPNIDNFTKPNQ